VNNPVQPNTGQPAQVGARRCPGHQSMSGDTESPIANKPWLKLRSINLMQVKNIVYWLKKYVLKTKQTGRKLSQLSSWNSSSVRISRKCYFSRLLLICILGLFCSWPWPLGGLSTQVKSFLGTENWRPRWFAWPRQVLYGAFGLQHRPVLEWSEPTFELVWLFGVSHGIV